MTEPRGEEAVAPTETKAEADGAVVELRARDLGERAATAAVRPRRRGMRVAADA